MVFIPNLEGRVYRIKDKQSQHSKKGPDNGEVAILRNSAGESQRVVADNCKLIAKESRLRTLAAKVQAGYLRCSHGEHQKKGRNYPACSYEYDYIIRAHLLLTIKLCPGTGN